MTWDAATVDRMRERIMEQAEELVTIRTEKGDGYDVPKRALHCFAMDRTAGRHLKPDWEPVSRPGMKMQMDCRYHTDCVIAAGFGPEDWRSSFSPSENQERYREFDAAIRKKRFDLQQELLGFGSAVLHDAGAVRSAVAIWPEVNGNDTYEVAKARVLVLPDALPKWAKHITEDVKGIVVEKGGELTHLAQVGREQGVTVMRVEDARSKFLPAACISLEPYAGQVSASCITSGYTTKRGGRCLPWGETLIEEAEKEAKTA